MKIGNVEVNSKLVLGPMAGVTDLAYRTICREMGAGLTITEMVSTKALRYQDQKTLPLLQLGKGEHPAAVQIFGSDPECMGESAAIAAEASGADIVDINMGCPVPKVANSGDGSGLMRTPELAMKVVESVVKGVKGKPVTVKIRLGWDKGSINCVEFAKGLEQAGASAIAIHGRTRAQQYAGVANWDYIREVKQAVNVPVIANGDVFEAKDAVRILNYTGADAVMIARGCFGNPWLFEQAKAAIEGREIPERPTLDKRLDVAVHQFEMAAEYKGERVACLEARKQYCWYLKGVPHAGYWKEQICKMETLEDMYRITAGMKRDLV